MGQKSRMNRLRRQGDTSKADAKSRFRMPFPGEFPGGVPCDALGCSLLVAVVIVRDGNGKPLHRARGLVVAGSGRA